MATLTMDYRFFVQWRKDMGFTQADVARHLHQHLVTVKRWETGKRTLPPYIGLLMAALENDLEPVGRHAMYPVERRGAGDPRDLEDDADDADDADDLPRP
jgi:Predicted transcriptional regulator